MNRMTAAERKARAAEVLAVLDVGGVLPPPEHLETIEVLVMAGGLTRLRKVVKVKKGATGETAGQNGTL